MLAHKQERIQRGAGGSGPLPGKSQVAEFFFRNSGTDTTPNGPMGFKLLLERGTYNSLLNTLMTRKYIRTYPLTDLSVSQHAEGDNVQLFKYNLSVFVTILYISSEKLTQENG